jgi:hypothetical protein
MWRQLAVFTLFSACLFLAVPAHAQTQGDQWVLLHRAVIDRKTSPQTISLPDDIPRTTALSLLARGKPIGLARMVITYGNGQIHFEDRELALEPDTRSRPIDEREALLVDSITLFFKPQSAAQTAATIEIWGRQPPSNRGEERSATGMTERDPQSRRYNL